MTKTMKAAILETYGKPFRIVDIPVPAPGPGDVLVRIAASSVNPLDTKIHTGAAEHARHLLPAILGIDLAGTVEAVGSAVTDFRPGDEVYGMAGGVGGLQGTLAEYAAVDADLLAMKPANLSMQGAAALPSVVITAWEGLVDRMRVGEGETVLVQGGAGGVGHVAIQIARSCGAEVFATGSAHSRAIIESLGAIFIDRTEPVWDYVQRLTGGRGFDRVYDTVGGAALDASFQAVRRFGLQGSNLFRRVHLAAAAVRRGASPSSRDPRSGEAFGRIRTAGPGSRRAALYAQHHVRRLPYHQDRSGQGQAGGRHHHLRQLAGRTGAVLYHAGVRGARPAWSLRISRTSS
jgi:NADPH:quinone reductase